jgi:transposase-like protein
MVRIIEERQNANEARRSIARDLGVYPNQLRRWQEKIDDHTKKSSRIPGMHFNPRACSLHPGRKSCLSIIEQELLRHVFESREQGVPVSVRLVIEF